MNDNININNFNDLETILNITSQISMIPKELILSRSRKREIVQARQSFIIVAVDLSDLSYTKIGKKVNRDHATVSHTVDIRDDIRNVVEFVLKIKKALTNIKKTITEIYNKSIEDNISADEFSNKIIEFISYNNRGIDDIISKIKKSISKIESIKQNDLIANEIKKIKTEINNISSILI